MQLRPHTATTVSSSRARQEAVPEQSVSTAPHGGGKETVSTVAAAGATETLNLATANLFDVTLDESVEFAFSGATNGTACAFTLIIRQDGSGGNSITWPSSVDWAGGTAPTISTTASDKSVLTFLTVDGGTSWFGALVGNDFS